MEIIRFIEDSPWSILLILIGLIFIFFGFKTLIKELKIKKTGIKTTAKVIGFDQEKSTEENRTPAKIPVFIFYTESKNQITVKGKSGSRCEIYEITPIYYNPKNPEKEFYLPKKDHLVKYLFFCFGLVFICLGLYFINRDSSEINPF